MQFLHTTIVIIALFAFLGVVFYTIVGGFYLFQAFPFERQTRREIFAHIPPLVRRVGYISTATFAGCLMVSFFSEFIAKLFR
jgi:hypothetical protein